MAIKYIPFYPEPIEGQAILDNFKRTLKYKGDGEINERLKRGMPFYEIEKIEQVGRNEDGNMLIRGECVSTCAYLKEKGIEVDLVYIDPPFASGADYAKKVYIRRNPKIAESIASAEQQLDIDELREFEETMYGDVWDKEKYLNWMYENLMAIKSVMSENASIYVHLDWHIGHYVKILMDEIFGEDNFKNEVIWVYKERESSTRYYNRKHDTIYFYTRSDDYIFNYKEIWEEYSETTLKKFKYVDKNGERYRLRYKDGRNDPTVESESTYRQYLKDAGGTLPRDWFIIPIVNQAANEREDYATQKPEALLERIIKASSNERMLVTDFFGGSGVTAAVAAKLGRRFITCDVGINSVQITRDRLTANGAEFDVFEIKDGVSLYRNPIQTMEKLKKLIPGLKNEDSLDSFWEGAISDSKLGIIPVYVPNLMDNSSKLLDEPAVFRIMHEAIPDLPENKDIKKVVIYYVDIDDIDGIRKFIADDDMLKIEIELRDLKELLDDIVAEDFAEFRVSIVSEGRVVPQQKVEVTRFVSDRVNRKIDEYNQKGLINSQTVEVNEEEPEEETKTKKKKFKPIIISENGLELIEYLSIDCVSSEGEWHSSYEIKIDKLGYVTANGKKTGTFWDGSISSDKHVTAGL